MSDESLVALFAIGSPLAVAGAILLLSAVWHHCRCGGFFERKPELDAGIFRNYQCSKCGKVLSYGAINEGENW